MKRYLVLVGVIFVMGLAWTGTAAAQVVFGVSSNTRTVRVEGTTEAVGQIVLTSSSSGTIKAGSIIQASYNTVVANDTQIAAATPGPGTPVNCSATACNTSINLTSTASPTVVITFTADVAFVPGNTITISQVRVNANALGKGATVSASVSAVVLAINQSTFPITFNTSTLASVATVFNGSATTVVVTPATSGLLTCTATSAQTVDVLTTENFAGALTSLADETGLSAFPAVTSGTHITITFSNIPSGLTVAFSTVTTPVGTLTLSGPVVTGFGTATTSFNFTVASDISTTINAEDFSFTTNAGPATAAGTASVSVSLTSPATGTGAALQVIQFAPNTQGSGNAFSAVVCETDLMFPFVANTFGFDTGIAIANTTSDPFPIGGAVPAAGTCTLTGFPLSGGASVSFTTPSIPAGGTFAFDLSSSANPALNGLEGYIIARCNFLNGHGFAFIVNGFGTAAGPSLAEGYLALVIPNPVLVPRTIPTIVGRPSTAGAGEGLVQ